MCVPAETQTETLVGFFSMNPFHKLEKWAKRLAQLPQKVAKNTKASSTKSMEEAFKSLEFITCKNNYINNIMLEKGDEWN